MHTFVDGISRRVNEIIEEFQIEDVPCIGNWEIFLKYAVKTLVDAIVWRGFQLEVFLERLQLDFEEVRVVTGETYFPKIMTFLNACFGKSPVRDALIGHIFLQKMLVGNG